MNNQAAIRERVIAKVKAGLAQGRVPEPFPEVRTEAAQSNIYVQDGKMPEEQFAIEFGKLGGKFIFCADGTELVNNLRLLQEDENWTHLLCADEAMLQFFHQEGLTFIEPADAALEKAEACITACEYLVARTGSILLSSNQHMGRVAPVYFPVHIVIARLPQIVADIDAGLSAMQQKYGANLPSMINLNTGPSRTADIEKTLVVGVHGPREVYCFLVA